MAPDPAAGGGPPPSTLAAELVGNISTTVRSSRPDENNELKRLLETIEAVRNNPESLKTVAERVGHNHVLIYVYACVVLDGLKWDDPFTSRDQLRLKTEHAVQFLKMTIQETPQVLKYTADVGAFLHRGREPLWVWLFPKLLKMLGHPHCLPLIPTLESFFHFVLVDASNSAGLWNIFEPMYTYLQANFRSIIAHLDSSFLQSHGLDLALPQQTLLDLLLPHLSGSDGCRGWFYSPVDNSHALRHASCLLNILRAAMVPENQPRKQVLSFNKHLSWLIDSFEVLNEQQKTWRNYKLDSIIVLLAADVAEFLGEFYMEAQSADAATTTQTSKTLAFALLHLTDASSNKRPVAKLVTAKLLKLLDRLRVEDHLKDKDLERRHFTCYPTFRPGWRASCQAAKNVTRGFHRATAAYREATLRYRRLAVGNLLTFSRTTRNCLSEADDPVRCLVLDLLCRLLCASDGTLVLAPAGRGEMQCLVCSKRDNESTPPGDQDMATHSAVFSLFVKLISLSSFRISRRPRVVAMVALRRVILHCSDPDMLDLEKSALGQWCLQALNSSLREFRIAAGRAIALFLRPRVGQVAGPSVLSRNTANALSIMRSISDKNKPNISETCLMAWGQVGMVVSDEGLNLVLVKMLEFLGNQNPIISAVALNEMTNLASCRKTTPRRLLEPFWRNLAYATVKDMLTRPQTTQMVADLLKTSITELLLLIQSHALPWLVLYRKKDIIQRFLDARRELSRSDPQKIEPLWKMLYFDGANLSTILSRLLVQDVPDIEAYARSVLFDVCPELEVPTLRELLSTNPVPTALELLKMSGDGDQSMKASARSALALVAGLLMPDQGGRRKSHHVIGRFLCAHALGLSTRMIQVITDDLSIMPPIQERRRCIRAMEEMIVLGKEYIRTARPQISVCLLSALSLPDLRSDAFMCWYSMLNHMEEEDVEALIETTFFIIGQYWSSLDQATQEKTKSLLQFLLSEHKDVLKKTAPKLPSLGHIGELAEIWQKFDAGRIDVRNTYCIFIQRVSHENSGVVAQALAELSAYLRQHQGYLQTSAISEQPDSVVTQLSRALLDCASKYNSRDANIPRLCAECIGFMGCLDSTRMETAREQREFVMSSNFEDAEETTNFVGFILEEVLIKSFLSTTDVTLQGYLSYVMQELLKSCDYKAAVAMQGTEKQSERIYQKWQRMPEVVREVLTPFLTSQYAMKPIPAPVVEYPIFRAGRSYTLWLKQFTLDLLHKAQNTFAQLIFEPLCRAIRVKDLSIAVFLLPYLVIHMTLGQVSTTEEKDAIWNEILLILRQNVSVNTSYLEREDKYLFYEVRAPPPPKTPTKYVIADESLQAVFRIIDYAMRWIQVQKASPLTKAGENNVALIQKRLDAIPAELLSQRAIDCKQYARALFHLEPYVLRQEEEPGQDAASVQRALDSLQHVYTQIDEPDGLEGISANLKVIDLNQQILSHRKAGRWSRAQTWCEVQLAEDPNSVDVQLDLLTCLKQSGQYDVLLNYVSGMATDVSTINKIAPFAVEAAWATSRWETLQKYLDSYNAGNPLEEFNLGVGSALLALKDGQTNIFADHIQKLKDQAASSMSLSATASLQAAHEAMLKCHVLADLDIIAGDHKKETGDQQKTMTLLSRRLEVLGAYVNDKQYVLGIRRAAMELMRPKFTDGDISSLWLSSARLARKADSLHQSFNAVLHASQLGDGSATIENARLLWKEGHHRKAIQILENAIQTDSFIGYNLGPAVAPTSSKAPEVQRNLLTARAHLLLAKWQDSTGQTHASALRSRYQQAARMHATWEKGHYYLGRHYKKVLESEKALSPDEQSDEYLTGETAKLVIENYLRSLNFGTKYLYQTLPRILTLWMDLGAQVNKAPEGKVSLSKELHQRRKTLLHELNKYFNKHMQRMPAYIFYTAMPQIVARITHPNPDIVRSLQQIIVKIVEAHPRQALWGLFAIMTTRQSGDRARRGNQLLHQLRDSDLKGADGTSFSLPQLCRMGEKLAEQLLLACNNGDFQSNRTTHASITRDLNFNHKCTPCPLVVPIETCLTATLPTLTDNIKKHKAFSRDVIAIDSFLDDVLVLGSLAKPRRLTARGSDGKLYNLLIKPKDDLRTDQRLMEFNGMINRSLKRDAESSRRQLYIRTYAVTPLNEECGIIEWVDGLKTLRDILLGIYKTRGVAPNYGQIAQLMKEATLSDKNISMFTEQILGMFPPVLPSWFMSQFPNPSAWFAARLTYTRSCAVMSMVGTILGLGDRHGENVLLEEGNGGVFHVDFNCLFDKGLTFAQPERVPFRLTHNMVAAMGIYGYEGPFRQCSELTLSILRQQEETLMTILEAFIYDPTLDLQRDKKRKNDLVRLNPTSVVESIRRKVKGLLPDESIPLGVEGQVEELIRQATNPKNLASMYIGWCPFL
ncbi:hypothetical protein M406DRAFT_98727 [Cryphonectria parasitica EP155]|uniref:Serine/threonine-protein kinase MEC1 n=1 Tax=Cryphonectria parasitica (strain ATCC 38755 / EP155) TaxID=660469 RepID=A0A9P5CRL8_CRYP1|nr:uncharacterized protein M406DRAFT_98727 [Cryphonectria parasitica EP155]KAF3768709.1 hypothetical protein M406DRAFT_98727 [Cryphonectria parasitica EP155]